MSRPVPALLLLAALAAAAGIASSLRCAAEDAKPAAANVPKPAGGAAGVPDEVPAAPRDPAGMVRFAGGKTKIGIDRKEMMEFIAGTDLGRMGTTVQAGIENEFSLSTPERVATLPALWMGKFEVTSAQWQRFLESCAKTTYVVPGEGKPGARTLEEISRLFLIAEKFRTSSGKVFWPTAVGWKGLYDLNEEAINPSVGGDGKAIEPAARPKADVFQNTPLRPGTSLTVYRWTVPMVWSVGGKLRASPPPGRENHPVTGVSLCDALAFASYYGRHIPREEEWEGAARGPKGEIFPEGKWDPLGHAWKFFNPELEKAQVEAGKAIAEARKRLETAKKVGHRPSIDDAQERVDRLEWILAAKPLPDPLDPPIVDVGMFPFGRSPCGAHDMVGNVEEWVSTPLLPYPGTDSKSIWTGAKASIFRGGNLIDKEALLEAIFRKFLADGSPIHQTRRDNSGGFRVARYDAPGASASVRAVMKVMASEPAILPREQDPKTKLDVGPDLDVYGAVGIERLNEVAWHAAGSPQNDPPGKVFLLGEAQSVCVIPATGTPLKDAVGVHKAAEMAGVPVAVEGKKTVDKRQPREVPFFGLLHLTDGMEVKGIVQTEVVKQVPLTAEERKALEDEWKARKKAEEAKNAEGDKKDDGETPPPKDGGGETPPPDSKMQPKPGDNGKGGKKGGKKEEPKKEEPKKEDPPKEEPKKEDPPAEDAPPPEEEDEDKPTFPTTKDVKELVLKPGFARGKDHPDGFLLGLQSHGNEHRGVLWEARPGIVGSRTATGGVVLLEPPLVILPEGALEFKRVSRVNPGQSTFDSTSGDVTLVFYVPIEDAKGAALEVTLKLKLGDIPADPSDQPWLTMSVK